MKRQQITKQEPDNSVSNINYRLTGYLYIPVQICIEIEPVSTETMSSLETLSEVTRQEKICRPCYRINKKQYIQKREVNEVRQV